MLEKAHISEDILDNREKALKAISGVTVIWGEKHNSNAHKMSYGIIPLRTTSPEIEEIDP